MLPVYFLPVWGTLRAFIKTNLDFADQENVVVRDSILEVDLKINSRNWSLVVVKSSFFWKWTGQESYCHDKWEGLYQTDSLDMRHLIIILTKMRYCKWCVIVISVIYVFVMIFVNIYEMLKCILFLFCVIYLNFAVRFV